MGFFQGIRQLITGRPASQSSEKSAPAGQPQSKLNRFVDERGYKIIPEVELARTKSHINGEMMTVTTWATNRSAERIRLDHMVLLDQKQTILQELAPGQGREVKLYDGPVAKHEHTTRGELTFRLLANGDAFSITYFIKFDRQSNGSFVIKKLRPDGPARDI